MRKSVSTKLAEPIPAEFEGVFVQFGWERANRIFGKRASQRYFTAVGSERLRQQRDAYLSERRAAAAQEAKSGVKQHV
jgi:hypothetical protein